MRSPIVMCACLATACASLLAAQDLNVRDFGAKGDGAAKDTAAIQKAIDAAAQHGGGVVRFPAGTYLSGTVHLKSDVTLYLASGAVLLGSPDNNDFDPYETLPFQSVSDRETTYFHYALVTGENVHNIAILGQGAIDGNRTRRGGPKTVALKLCRHVAIRGITVRNSPNYSISFWGCDYVDVDGVTILNSYADGIDPDACRYVRISNCFIDSHDDAICPKTSPTMGLDQVRSTEHLTVTNCVLSTDANNIKLGTESSGNFRNLAFSNCTMFPRAPGRHSDGGIAIESVDGAQIEGIVVSNISMRGVLSPIFIRLGNRGRGLNPPVPGFLRNVSIQNVVASECALPSTITGIPGRRVEHVALDGINVTAEGGGAVRGLDVPEVEAKYPNAPMFGPLPSYALYARHVDGLTVGNFQARWTKEDARPAFIFDEVQDLDLHGFSADTVTGDQPVIWLNDILNALVRGSRMRSGRKFLRVTGARSRNVSLIGNDLSGAAEPIEYGSDVARSVVRAVANAGKP